MRIATKSSKFDISKKKNLEKVISKILKKIKELCKKDIDENNKKTTQAVEQINNFCIEKLDKINKIIKRTS